MPLDAAFLQTLSQQDLNVLFAVLQAAVEDNHAPQDQLRLPDWERAKELCKAVTAEADARLLAAQAQRRSTDRG